MLSRIKEKSDAPGITLLANPRIGRSGRTPALTYPPLRLKHIYVYDTMVFMKLSIVLLRLFCHHGTAKTPFNCGFGTVIYTTSFNIIFFFLLQLNLSK